MNHCYTTQGLRKLWEQYHHMVHLHQGPCDASVGDPCHVTSFLDWLDTRLKNKGEIMKRVRPMGKPVGKEG